MRRPWPAIAPTALFLPTALLVGCLQAPPAGGEPTGPQDAVISEGEVIQPARSLVGLYEVGQVRAFEFMQLGEVIGRSWGRYEGTVEVDGRKLHQFSTKIELLPPGGKPLRWASQLLLDDQGNLVSGWERSIAAELRFDVTGDGSQDKVLRIDADAGLEDIEHEELGFADGTAFMGYMSTIHEELMLALRQLTVGENSWRLISLSAGRADEWSAKVSQKGKTLVLETSLGEEIWLEEGRIARIEVREDELLITPLAAQMARWPEWEVTGPQALTYNEPEGAHFVIRPVELPGQGDDAALYGEVLVPDPALAGPGPFPAVVFLGGSVSADRHGFAGPPAVDLGYHEISDALAEAGFVVIRYDERGIGQSAPAPASWVGQQEDAQRAFRTLLVQPEVDPDHILVVGHAEGGWRALALAHMRPKEVVGVILLATPGRSYRELFATSPDILAALESGKNLPKNLEPMAQWYGEILVEDPDALIFKVRAPIWLAQGGRDFEVDPVKDVAALQAAATKYKRKLTVKRFPELDHHFKYASEGANHASYLEKRAVDRAFLKDLVDWAREAVGR